MMDAVLVELSITLVTKRYEKSASSQRKSKRGLQIRSSISVYIVSKKDSEITAWAVSRSSKFLSKSQRSSTLTLSLVQNPQFAVSQSPDVTDSGAALCDWPMNFGSDAQHDCAGLFGAVSSQIRTGAVLSRNILPCPYVNPGLLEKSTPFVCGRREEMT